MKIFKIAKDALFRVALTFSFLFVFLIGKGTNSDGIIVNVPFSFKDGVLIGEIGVINTSTISNYATEVEKFTFGSFDISFINAKWKNSNSVSSSIDITKSGSFTFNCEDDNLRIVSISWCGGSSTLSSIISSEPEESVNATLVSGEYYYTWISSSGKARNVEFTVKGNDLRIKRFVVEYVNLAHEIKKISLEYDKLRYLLHGKSDFQVWDGSSEFDGKVEEAKDENDQVLIKCQKIENTPAENPYGVISQGGFEVRGGNAQELVSLINPRAKMVALSMRASDIVVTNTADKSRYFVEASSGSFYCVGDKPNIITDWGDIEGVNEVLFTPASGDNIHSGPVWKTLDIYYYLEEEPLEASESPEIEGSAKFVGSTVVKMNMPAGITDTKIYYTTNGKDPEVKVLPNKDIQVISAQLYDVSGITISETTEFRALAVTEGHDVSPVVTAKFEKLEASVAPTIGGEDEFDTNTTVTISASDTGAKIYYTLDGSAPQVKYAEGTWVKSLNTQVYSNEFVLTESAVVKAIAISEGQGPSAVVEKSFVKMARAEQPDLSSSDKQLFSDNAVVKINSLPEGAKVLYTVDGSKPSYTEAEAGPVPTGSTRVAEQDAITISESCTLKVVVWEKGKLPSQPVSIECIKTTAASTPQIVGEHHFIGSTTVKITASENASIYYTTDGSSPFGAASGACKLYSEPLILTETTTVKAISLEDNLAPSAIVERTFTRWAATPTPSIKGDLTFVDQTKVSIEGVPGATIYYTLDNSDPSFIISTDGTVAPKQGTHVYTDAIPLTAGLTVKAVAVIDGSAPSAVVTAVFEKQDRSVAPKIVAPELFYEEATVNMTAISGAKIYYTTDGSDPIVDPADPQSSAATLYEAPIILTVPATIKAVALEEGKAPSVHVTAQVKQASRTSKPVLSLPLEFEEEAEISIEAADARIFYTLGRDSQPEVTVSESNGSISWAGDTKEYTAPFKVSSTSVVKVVAVEPGKRVSEMVTGITTMKGQTPTPVINGETPFVKEVGVTIDAPLTARVLYTLDGSLPEWELDTDGLATPKEGSTTLIYGNGSTIKITDRTIVRAIAHERGKTVSEIVSVTFVPADATPAPKISGRTPFAVTTEVSLMAGDEAKLFYTIDGSDPDVAGTWYLPRPQGATKEYVSPFQLSESAMVKAVAWEKMSSLSAVAEAEFAMFPTCAAPEINGSNPFEKETEIRITAPNGSEVYYSLDGSAPHASLDDRGVITGGPIRYTGPFKIVESAIVKAVAVSPQSRPSEVVSAEFMCQGKCEMPVIAAAELFGDEAVVEIQVPKGAVARYTLDGSEPDETSKVYAAPFTVDSPVEVRARAWKEGFQPSNVAVTVMRQMERSESVEISGTSPFVHEAVVTLTAAPLAKIYYSTDGAAPVVKVIGADKVEVSDNANLYESPFKINSEEHIIAVALEGSKRASEPVERRFERAGVTAKPSISGVTPFLESTVVTITATQGAEIYFTLDGSEPTSSSLHYTEPFTLNYSALVRAIAKLPQSDFSTVAEMRFEKSALSAKPIIEAPALFGDEAHVKIKGEGDIWFTLDGTVPQPRVSDRYVAELLLTEPFTLKAIAQADGKLPSEVAEHIGRQMERTESVVISGNELFEGSTTVTLEAGDADVWYTLDGTLPTVRIIDDGEPQVSEGAILYKAPFEISTSLTVSAVAIEHGKRASLPTQRSFERKDQSLAPSISGTNPFETQTLVTITAKSGAQIYFTLDGTKPDQGSSSTFLYREPLLLTTTTLVRAIAVEEGKAVSPVAESLFEKMSLSRRPEIDVVELFGDEADVTITAAPGARIFFTIDGSMPDASAEEYTGPFVIVSSAVIRAIAIEEGKAPSVMTEKQVVQMERSSSPEYDTEEWSDGSFRVSISALAGASVYYSIDQPTQLTLRNQEDLVVGGSTQAYTQPIMVAPGSQIYAMALKSGSRPSEIMTAAMPARDAASAPVIEGDSPFEETTLVSMSAEEGLKIFYTTDGQDPVVKRGLDDEPVSGSSSTLEFYVPFEISVSKVIKAVAVGAGKAVSPLAVKEFERVDPTGISDLTSDDSSVKVGKGSITGPADMKVFDAWGRPCKREGLRPGVYIIVIGSKSFKVMVKS